MRAMSTRLPGPLYEELRKRAYDLHVPMNRLVIRAVHAMLHTDPQKFSAWLEKNPAPEDPDGD